jgi:hypothetical protein
MTKRLARAMFCFLLWTSVEATIQQGRSDDRASIAGRWLISAQGPHALSLALTLDQEGTRLTGTLANPHGGADFPVAGTFADRKLTLAVTSGADLELAGELKSDGTLAGTLSSARGDLEWTAKRAAEK